MLQNSTTSTGAPYQLLMWFPTSVYAAEDTLPPGENEKLIQRILEIKQTIATGGENWQCNTYNTLGTYNLINDPVFSTLVEKVEEHVFEYVRCMGSAHHYKCQEAWANVSEEYSYQEYHTHSDRTISAVYYAAVPEASGRIFFESPLEPDMLPIKNIDNYNMCSNRIAHFSPNAGTILIFRSYLRHMVEMNRSKDPRISIAFNF
jgi:uncharacterized protein (TIGR02466 family)